MMRMNETPFEVATKTRESKWRQMRAKGYSFFATLSIPGVARIFTTEWYVLKALWTLLVLFFVSLGLYTIHQSAGDFYNYDVITNVEKTKPSSVTFPAISLCIGYSFSKSAYFTANKSLIYRESEYNRTLGLRDSIVVGFTPDSSVQYFFETSQLEFFNLPRRDQNCFRFNGATHHENSGLFAANGTFNALFVEIYKEHRVDISDEVYFVYHYMDFVHVDVYVEDNHLNSLDQSISQRLPLNNLYEFKISVPTIETKLGEPYNACRESPSDEPYRQMNCIEACVYDRIRHKYNCTFDSLFRSEGVRECLDPSDTEYRRTAGSMSQEFSSECETQECPVSCYSVQFSLDYTQKPSEYPTTLVFRLTDQTSLNITQIPKLNAWSFISNVGGSLGLFMGISFLNFVEIFEFLIDLVLIAFVN